VPPGVNFRFVPFFHSPENFSDSIINTRNFTAKQAKNIGVTGYVQNASDGTVSIVVSRLQGHWLNEFCFSQVKGEAQGSEDTLKELVNHLSKGPSAANVTGVEHKDVDTKEGETGFAVR
jgi:acylphosphatase